MDKVDDNRFTVTINDIKKSTNAEKIYYISVDFMTALIVKCYGF